MASSTDFEYVFATELARLVQAVAPVGPLLGVPTPIKDLSGFNLDWIPTFGGIRALDNQVIDAFCVFAERIEEAGVAIVGDSRRSLRPRVAQAGIVRLAGIS